MSLSGSRSRLAAISKELSIRWSETKGYWKDTKSLATLTIARLLVITLEL